VVTRKRRFSYYRLDQRVGERDAGAAGQMVVAGLRAKRSASSSTERGPSPLVADMLESINLVATIEVPPRHRARPRAGTSASSSTSGSCVRSASI
jgi:hypothetical protein